MTAPVRYPREALPRHPAIQRGVVGQTRATLVHRPRHAPCQPQIVCRQRGKRDAGSSRHVVEIPAARKVRRGSPCAPRAAYHVHSVAIGVITGNTFNQTRRWPTLLNFGRMKWRSRPHPALPSTKGFDLPGTTASAIEGTASLGWWLSGR